MTRYRKNGEPISAVTTPNFSSGPCEITLTSISAANVRFIPPSMLKGNKIPGRKSAMGLNKCGTTNPTKPMIPEIDTATPTANEIPITIVHLILWRQFVSFLYANLGPFQSHHDSNILNHQYKYVPNTLLDYTK